MSRDKHNEEYGWNNDVYKTITFESDEVVDEKSYEAFTYLARREELRELLIRVYPPLGYNVAGGGEAATHLANVILANGYRKSTDLAEEIFAEIEEGINKEKAFCEKGSEASYERWMIRFWEGGAGALSRLVYFIAELKKKYIGKDTNVPANTEGGE